MRREHIKLTTQNVLAAEYLFQKQETAIEAGLAVRERFESLFEMNLKTAKSHLESLEKYPTLPAVLAEDALSMNRDLRRIYDEDLKGRKAFAQMFGSTTERLLPLDGMFTPNEGWKIYTMHFGGGR
jgi:hypothetical protein